MLHQYTLNISVLLFTFFLSTLINVSSGSTYKCNVGLTGVFPDPSGGVACSSDDGQQHECKYNSCFNNGHKWIPMKTCRVYGSAPNDPNISAQQCADYVWVNSNTFTCVNPGGKHYSCYGLTPATTPYMTCSNCQ
ncbi:uncharacterized protein MELLADRAFT_124165 [Melampsora larici-populina 98AG31]|uniref:Secreted protein n=1 Tax=Melampsora larici-populina (strain 98AG31 / pathotype 3-4-7) TaxID=747676 RepID=F4RUB6_MELLP|nr:uncharacterized protein MELLADRAFT_124165 [Melampsora larici-populina 98AG31]EGG04027.1 secreted protein [Melampsora larici-populina 98AG31]